MIKGNKKAIFTTIKGIKYKQTYIFLKIKKTIFNIKLHITFKSHETFIKQNTRKQKIEEQIKKIKT